MRYLTAMFISITVFGTSFCDQQQQIVLTTPNMSVQCPSGWQIWKEPKSTLSTASDYDLFYLGKHYRLSLSDFIGGENIDSNASLTLVEIESTMGLNSSFMLDRVFEWYTNTVRLVQQTFQSIGTTLSPSTSKIVDSKTVPWSTTVTRGKELEYGATSLGEYKCLFTDGEHVIESRILAGIVEGRIVFALYTVPQKMSADHEKEWIQILDSFKLVSNRKPDR